jgi:hypothetical protein
MKLLLFCSLIVIFCGYAYGDEFLGAPIMDGGEITKKTDSELEQVLPKSHGKIVAFYKDAFKDDHDISYRDRGNITYIEELGSKPWHSIIISPIDTHRTKVLIIRDNWIWTLKNLILPFAGVFLVLFVLYLATSICGAIFSRKATTRKIH